MAALTAKIEKDELVIRIPVNSVPVPSASGKTLVVCPGRGNVATECIVDGKRLVIGLNAYITK